MPSRQRAGELKCGSPCANTLRNQNSNECVEAHLCANKSHKMQPTPRRSLAGSGPTFKKCALKALVFQRSFKRPSFAKTNADFRSEFFLEQEIRAGRFVIIHTKTVIERRQADLGHVFEFDSNTCIDSSARCLRGLDGRTVRRMDAA